MKDICRIEHIPFVILIDEWDCIFCKYRDDKDAQKEYLDFLCDWLKGQNYAVLCYMTGILPIKKYSTRSALNMFDEYSMIDLSEAAGERIPIKVESFQNNILTLLVHLGYLSYLEDTKEVRDEFVLAMEESGK